MRDSPPPPLSITTAVEVKTRILLCRRAFSSATVSLDGLHRRALQGIFVAGWKSRFSVMELDVALEGSHAILLGVVLAEIFSYRTMNNE